MSLPIFLHSGMAGAELTAGESRPRIGELRPRTGDVRCAG